jgi:hypothetical protein
MNRLLSLTVLVVVAVLLGQSPQPAWGKDKEPELPIPKEKWDLSAITKIKFGRVGSLGYELKLVGIKYDGKKEVTFTLQFPADLKPGYMFHVTRLAKSRTANFHFYKGSESVAKTNAYTVKGNITGKKGDTFRLILELPDDVDLKEITKVVVRRAR